jgi:hypothetical protein
MESEAMARDVRDTHACCRVIITKYCKIYAHVFSEHSLRVILCPAIPQIGKPDPIRVQEGSKCNHKTKATSHTQRQSASHPARATFAITMSRQPPPHRPSARKRQLNVKYLGFVYFISFVNYLLKTGYPGCHANPWLCVATSLSTTKKNKKIANNKDKKKFGLKRDVRIAPLLNSSLAAFDYSYRVVVCGSSFCDGLM